jgi:hypothetical protein
MLVIVGTAHCAVPTVFLAHYPVLAIALAFIPLIAAWVIRGHEYMHKRLPNIFKKPQNEYEMWICGNHAKHISIAPLFNRLQEDISILAPALAVVLIIACLVFWLHLPGAGEAAHKTAGAIIMALIGLTLFGLVRQAGLTSGTFPTGTRPGAQSGVVMEQSAATSEPKLLTRGAIDITDYSNADD